MPVSMPHTQGVRVAAVCYSLLILLALMVAAGRPVAGLDALAAEWASAPLGTGTERVWLWITTLAGGASAVAVMAAVSLMLIRAGTPRVVLAQWGGFLLARLVTEGLKFALARARPPLDDLDLLLAGATNYAFPSGHATSAIYIYGFIALLMMRSGLPRGVAMASMVLLSVVIATIALSRIVLGVHFASDVLGGLLSGGAALAVASHGIPRRPAR